MIARVKNALFTFILASVIFHAASVGAQTQAPPDLTGMWINQYTPDLSRALGHQPPFTPLGAERWRTVDTSKDPTSRCLPPGPTRAFTAPYPFLLVQHGTMIGFMYEYMALFRAIYMDGREHPAHAIENPDYMGHSVGHWEGKVLVVDTVALNDGTWLDTAGHEHSDKLTVVERFERDGPNLKYTATFTDPVFFTKPWSITRTFTPGKSTDRILPYTCTENNRDLEHLVPNQPNLDYKHVPEP